MHVITYNNDPLSNPTLNVTATDMITDSQSNDKTGVLNKYEVGIMVTGPLDSRKVSLYSNPPNSLSQEDILSLLILGYVYNENDNPSILEALGALQIAQSGIESSGGINMALRKSLGLSELGISQSNNTDAIGNRIDESASSLVIGKYLNKHTYIRYLKDLSGLNQSQEFQLRLILSNYLTLQLSEIIQDLNNDQRVDLIYSRSK